MTRRTLVSLLIALSLIACVGATHRAPVAPSGRLIGANYNWWSFTPCADLSTFQGILAQYGTRSVRRSVQQQLATMHGNGLTTLRLLVRFRDVNTYDPYPWSLTLTTGATPQLSSADVRSVQNFLSDVVGAGFGAISVSMAPVGNVGPQFPAQYQPALVEDDWRVAVQLHDALVGSRIPMWSLDLLNEGAPNIYTRPCATPPCVKGTNPTYDADLEQYITTMWSRWADSYGNANGVVSSITEDPQALIDLIGFFGETGRGYPGVFEVHAYMWWYADLSQGIYDGLTQDDATLTNAGIMNPLALRETWYDNTAIASGIAQWVTDHPARVLTEVSEWPWTSDQPCPTVQVSVGPPYDAAAYLGLQ